MSKPVAQLIPDPDYRQLVQIVYKDAVRAFGYGTSSLNILCFLIAQTREMTCPLGHLT